MNEEKVNGNFDREEKLVDDAPKGRGEPEEKALEPKTKAIKPEVK